MDTFTFASSSELQVPVNVKVWVIASQHEICIGYTNVSGAVWKAMRSRYHILLSYGGLISDTVDQI